MDYLFDAQKNQQPNYYNQCSEVCIKAKRIARNLWFVVFVWLQTKENLAMYSVLSVLLSLYVKKRSDCLFFENVREFFNSDMLKRNIFDYESTDGCYVLKINKLKSFYN